VSSLLLDLLYITATYPPQTEHCELPTKKYRFVFLLIHFMILKNDSFKIDVTSEIGNLRSLLIHSPDSGLGKVVPSKAQDWLFEDIVHLDTVRKNEYDYYVKLLMYFLDPDKIKGKLTARLISVHFLSLIIKTFTHRIK